MLIERLMKLALLGSEWVLYLMFTLSIISIATILERVWFFKRRTGGAEPLRVAVSEQLRAGSVQAAAKLLQNKQTLEARVGHQALLWANCGPSAVDDAVESELTRVRKELERVWFFKRRTGGAEPLRVAVSEQLRAGSVQAAAKLLQSKQTLEARVGHQALLWANCGPSAVDDAVESELTRVRKELERGANFLGTVGNNAPFIGLFGTVLGVIIAFHALGSAAQNANSMNHVMAGIAEALVATGVGLLVAIPAVVAYNVLQKRIGEVEADALSMVRTITAHLKANPDAFLDNLEEAGAVEPEKEEALEAIRQEPSADGAAA